MKTVVRMQSKRYTPNPHLEIWVETWDDYHAITDQQAIELAKAHEKYTDIMPITVKVYNSAVTRVIRPWTAQQLQEMKTGTPQQSDPIVTKEAEPQPPAQPSPLEVLRAYQHFLYYFDQVTFKEANIFGQTLTDHFLGKLSMYRKIHSPEGYNSLAVLVTWVQNMTDHYQAQLMEEYILKFHSNKW